MISFVPQQYNIIDNMKAARKFYADLLQSFGVPARSVTVHPLHTQGDFSLNQNGVGTMDRYFDIGNGALAGIIVGNQVSKSFYHGNLELVSFLSEHFGGGTCSVENWLASGQNASLTHFGIQLRAGLTVADAQFNAPGNAALATNPTTAFRHTYHGVLFNYLRSRLILNAGAIECTAHMEFMFTGVRIDY